MADFQDLLKCSGLDSFKHWIELCKRKPEVLNEPEMSFFLDYLNTFQSAAKETTVAVEGENDQGGKVGGGLKNLKQIMDATTTINITTGLTPCGVEADHVLAKFAKSLGLQFPADNINKEFNTAKYPEWEEITLLHLAALEENEEVVNILLEYPDVRVNADNKDGITPLMIAAQYGPERMLNKMLKYCDIKWRNRYVQSALTRAASGNFQYIGNLLKDERIDVNQDDQGSTALHAAAFAGKAFALKQLLAHPNINVNALAGGSSHHEDWDNEHALHLAAMNGHSEIIKILSEDKRVNMNIKNGSGKTVLNVLAEEGDAATIKLLLDHPDIEVTDIGDDIITKAAEKGQIDMIKIMLDDDKIKSTIIKKPDLRRTLSNAAETGDVESLKFFLKNPNFDVTDQLSNLLLTAAKMNQIEVVKVLLTVDGIDINEVDENGSTPLHLALCCPKLIKILLDDDRIDSNIKDKHGDTAIDDAIRWDKRSSLEVYSDHNKIKDNDQLTKILRKAVKDGWDEIVKLILNKPDIDINKTDDDGNTVLHTALAYDMLTSTKMLLDDERIDTTVKNANGETALDAIIWLNKRSAVEVFLGYPKIEETDQMIKIFEHAASEGWEEIVQIIMNKPGIDINKTNEYGWTVLHFAMAMNSLSVAKMLLDDERIDTTIKDKDGETALDQAIKRCHLSSILVYMDHPKIVAPDKWKEIFIKAVREDCEDVAIAALRSNAIDTDYANENSLLAQAAKRDWLNVVGLLLEKDAININKKDAEENTALHYSISSDNLEITKLLLNNEKIDTTIKNHRRNTAFEEAFQRNIKEFVKYFLEHPKFDVADQGDDILWKLFWKEWDDLVNFLLQMDYDFFNMENENNVLIRAIKTGNIHVLDHYLEHPKVDITEHLDALLSIACEEERCNAIELLLTRDGININHVNEAGDTPLHLAVKKDLDHGVKTLLADERIDPSIKDKEGNTAMKLAHQVLAESVSSSTSYRGVLKALLEHPKIEAPPDLLDDFLRTASKDSSFRSHIEQGLWDEVVQIIMKKPEININSIDDEGNTPLHLAMANNILAVAKLLLADDRIDTTIKNMNENTPLDEAVKGCHYESFEYYMNHPKLDPTSCLSKVLVQAANDRCFAIVSVIMEKRKDDIDFNYLNKKSFLVTATKDCMEDVVKILLAQEEIDINKGNERGETALHFSAWGNNLDITKMLLEDERIVPTTKNTYGETALKDALDNLHLPIVKCFLEYPNIDVSEDMADLLLFLKKKGEDSLIENLLKKSDENFIKANEKDILIRASEEGYFKLVKSLLGKSTIEINKTNEKGDTALHIAAKNNQVAVAKFLLADERIDVTIKNEDGNTPLDEAIKVDSTNVEALLRDHKK